MEWEGGEETLATYSESKEYKRKWVRREWVWPTGMDGMDGENEKSENEV